MLKEDKSLQEIAVLFLMIPFVVSPCQYRHARFKFFGANNWCPIAAYRFGQNGCPISINYYPTSIEPVVKAPREIIQSILSSSMIVYFDKRFTSSQAIAFSVKHLTYIAQWHSIRK